MGLVTKQAYSNTISIVIGFVAGAINTIIVLPRAFENSLDDWGLLKLILSIAMILAPVFGIGVNNIVIREYGGSSDTAYRKSILGFTTLVGIVGTLLVLVFIYVGGVALFTNAENAIILKKNMGVLSVLTVSLILSQVFIGFIVSNHKTPVIPRVNDLFLKLVYLGLSLVYLFWPFDFELFLSLYVGTYVMAFAIFALYSIMLGFRTSFWFRNLDIKELLTYGTYTVLDRGAAIIVANLDIIMIAYLLKLSNVAIYGLAFFMAAVLLIPQRALMTPAYPLVSKSIKENKMGELKKLYKQSSLNQFIIGGALFALLWTSIDGIYQLIPMEFSQGKWVVFYIGLSRLFILSTGISGPIIVFSKYYRVNLVFNLFLVGLTILSNYLLINKYGMEGAAMATALTFLTYNILKVVYIQYRFKMQPFYIETFKSIIVLIITGVIGSYIEIFPQNPLVSILLKSTIVGILLILGFYGLKVKAEILELPAKLFKKIEK